MPNPVLHIYCKAHSKVGMYNRKFYTGIEPKVGNECCFARGWLSLLSHLSSSNIRNGRKFPPPINSWFLVVHDPLLPFTAALRSPYLHLVEHILGYAHRMCGVEFAYVVCVITSLCTLIVRWNCAELSWQQGCIDAWYLTLLWSAFESRP